MLLDPAAPSTIPCVAEFFFRRKFVDVAKVNQGRCFEESGQRLGDVDQTHLYWLVAR